MTKEKALLEVINDSELWNVKITKPEDAINKVDLRLCFKAMDTYTNKKLVEVEQRIFELSEAECMGTYAKKELMKLLNNLRF